MMTFTSVEEVREYFKNDKFATNAGMQVEEFSDDEVICSVELTDDHRNANGGIMGGAIFTLADLAFAVLVNNIHKPSVAAQVSINYLSGTKGKKLYARSSCIKTGRSTTVASVDIYDELGTKVALFTGTAFKL